MEFSELSRPQEPVKLNQKFYPFSISRRDIDPDSGRTFFKIDLQTDAGILFPFMGLLDYDSGPAKKIETITPFDLKLGYPFSGEDLDTVTRRAKLDKMNTEEIIDQSKTTKQLWIMSNWRSLVERGLAIEDWSGDRKRPGMHLKDLPRQYLSGLNIFLEFPDGQRYIGYQREKEKRGLTSVSRFYPYEIEGGRLPLPADYDYFYDFRFAGFALRVPNDPFQLEKIQAIFTHESESGEPSQARKGIGKRVF